MSLLKQASAVAPNDYRHWGKPSAEHRSVRPSSGRSRCFTPLDPAGSSGAAAGGANWLYSLLYFGRMSRWPGEGEPTQWVIQTRGVVKACRERDRRSMHWPDSSPQTIAPAAVEQSRLGSGDSVVNAKLNHKIKILSRARDGRVSLNYFIKNI